jgi:hypothetical protein
MTPRLQHRLGITLRTIQIVVLALIGIAAACVLKGFDDVALAAIVAILFAHSFSIETLRAYVILQSRESRR